MTEQRENALSRMVDTFKMTSALPEDLDLETPQMKAVLDSMTTARRNNFLAMAKEPGIRRL